MVPFHLSATCLISNDSDTDISELPTTWGACAKTRISINNCDHQWNYGANLRRYYDISNAIIVALFVPRGLFTQALKILGFTTKAGLPVSSTTLALTRGILFRYFTRPRVEALASACVTFHGLSGGMLILGYQFARSFTVLGFLKDDPSFEQGRLRRL